MSPSSWSARSRGADDLGRSQQLRADREAGIARRVHVDAQADLLAFAQEADDHVTRCLRLEIADCERALVLERCERLVEIDTGGAVDEQDLAGLELSDAAISLHDERPAVHCFATHGLIQRTAEGVAPEHADHERRLGVREGLLAASPRTE